MKTTLPHYKRVLPQNYKLLLLYAISTATSNELCTNTGQLLNRKLIFGASSNLIDTGFPISCHCKNVCPRKGMRILRYNVHNKSLCCAEGTLIDHASPLWIKTQLLVGMKCEICHPIIFSFPWSCKAESMLHGYLWIKARDGWLFFSRSFRGLISLQQPWPPVEVSDSSPRKWHWWTSEPLHKTK